ncbi:MAG: PD-(D/E)XK nuclease family protein, partial [bacterium]
DMSRTDVMQFAHAAPVPFAELVGGQPNLGDWELLTIDAGIVSGPEHWLPQLDALGGRPTDDEPPRAMDELPDLHRFVSALLETRRDVPGRGTWARITGWLVDAYDRFVGPCDGRERVCEVARGLADLDRTRVPATFDDLREALAERLGRDRTPAEGFQRGKVFIGGLFESRGLGFRAVIIPGLAERSFPATGRPDPILPDRQRRRLAHGGAYLPLKSARPVEERMLFALALGAATEHRTLAHSRLDVATGRDRVPSHFLIRLAEAVSGRRCDYRTLENAPGFERVSMFPSAGADRTLIDVDDRDLEMLTHLVAAGQHDRVLFLADLSPTFERGVRAEIARWQQDTFTPFDGLVPGAGRIVAAGEPIAPTRLETYLTCPFRYFLQVVLGIDELEEPEAVERIRPLERGRLVHRIFCRAYRDHFAGGGGLSADELAAALRQTADDVFRRAAPMGPALTWAIDRARIIEDLEHFARLDAEECRRAGARPALFEVRFGMPPRGPGEDEASTERPLELDLGGRTWRFKGKIDRVDELGDDGLRVIDYKTGKKRGRTNAFDGGRSLQLPLYLLAADMLRSGRRGRDARYAFATRRGGFHTVRFDRPALEDRMADLERIITTAEQSLEAGVFVCTPDSKHCRSCPFAAACGPNRELIFERKKDDPRLAPLLELAEIE